MPETIFLVSITFLLYTFAGYPALLVLISRARSRPVWKRYEPRTVSILLPVRNGESWLRTKLDSLLSLRYPQELLQIVVISDGSTDGTDACAMEYASRRLIEFVRSPRGGKALALNLGMEKARGDILFFTDVRQELDPESLEKLVACFADPSVGVVSGELSIRAGRTREEAAIGLYWNYEKWLRKRESQIGSVMGATGCIYAMRRDLAARLPAGTLADDMFLPLAALFQGYRVIFENSAKAFDYPTAIESEFRRKMRTQAGVYQIIGLYPRLLNPQNRDWLVFFSHKLARLLCPFTLLLAAAAAFGLPAPWRSAALTGQSLFYGLALADLWIPESFHLKRLSAPARSFVVLMAAAFCAAFVVLRPVENLWKETQVRFQSLL
ncbi:MAG: glycosyltransferase family 2 protein [Acidobacteriia bacterium]|nr:glycosyltransferase family 2 protein [Terriglobia bacterium]